MRTIYLFLLSFLFVACGGGGGEEFVPTVAPSTVSIDTASLTDGNVNIGLNQQLVASGGNGDYTWWISTSGQSLPAGLTLTTEGLLSGIPTEAVVRTVVLVAQDSDSELATRSLQIECRDIEIQGSAGAINPGGAFSLSASGGSSNYNFSLSSSGSGATISLDGDYIAGPSEGVDVIRATDDEGFYDELAVTVGTDPFVGFVAVWGTTDVWWVGWDSVYKPDPTYASDFDETLVALGLRAASSTGKFGTTEDDLARLLVIRRALGHLSTYFGNTFDGARAAGGLDISFVKPAGPTQGLLPNPAGITTPAAFRYNGICVRWGDTGGVVGTAYLDPTNNSIEHNCGDASVPLGVFVNRLLNSFRGPFGTGLSADPIKASDVPALQSLLLGNAPSGARETAIFDITNNWGRVVAAVLAHEIGHSIGLEHSTGDNGNLMNAGLRLGKTVNYAFNSTDWTQLAQSLPGPGR